VTIWFTSRAAGIAALLLSTLSVTLGLAMAARLLPRTIPRLNVRLLHEALALGTLAMIGVHGLALLLDPYMKPALGEILIPFTSTYRPVATAAGQIAAYGTAALALTYYARSRIGPRRWRSAHRFVTVFWLLALIHAAADGTDRTAWWFLVAVFLPALPAVFALLVRLDEASTPMRTRGLARD